MRLGITTPAQRRALANRRAALQRRRTQAQIRQLKQRDVALGRRLTALATRTAPAAATAAPDYSQPYYPQQGAPAQYAPAPDYSQPYYPQGEGFTPMAYDEGMDYSGDAAAKLFEAYSAAGDEGAAEGDENAYYEYESDYLGAARLPVRAAPAMQIAGVPVLPVALGVAALAALYFFTRKGARRGRK